MKKLIMVVLAIWIGAFSANAQEESKEKKEEFSKWQVRFRAIVVAPDESATIEGIGGDVDISRAFVPELDFTYFFTENWAAELILGTSKHDVKAYDTTVGNIDLGHVWLLPPTLTGQYHFYIGKFKPYVGAGVNLTIFYAVDEGPTVDDVEYDTSVGYAFQAGFDYKINDKWFFNADVKKIILSTTATVDATSALGAVVEADVDIDPWVVGFGLGMKF